MNSDAWQNAYITLSARIAAGTVDVDRPLKGLAYVTARNFFLSEQRRNRRLVAIADEQVERYWGGDGPLAEDLVENVTAGGSPAG